MIKAHLGNKYKGILGNDTGTIPGTLQPANRCKKGIEIYEYRLRKTKLRSTR